MENKHAFGHGTGGGAIVGGVTSSFAETCLRYPDEEEVLFLPNTTFRITSTLLGTTDIGKFYSHPES